MSKEFAEYLTGLIANDLENRLKVSRSSYELERMEKAFQNGKIKEIEIYLTHIMIGQEPNLDEIFND